MPSNLTIHPTKPFKSSRLALPPSPFSPRFPLSPSSTTTKRDLSPHHHHVATSKPSLDLPAPPSEPLHWLWQCHLCSRVYRLGITRRCLEDGHFFCSGTTTVKRARRGKNAGKKVVRHKACASEFDYAGWKAWGVWRRDCAKRVEEAEDSSDEEFGCTGEDDVPRPLFAPSVPEEGRWFGGLWAKKTVKINQKGKDFFAKDCWGTCDYPSECRWGKQYGVATPTLPPPPVPPKDTVVASTPKTKFEDILLTISEAPSGSETDGSSDEDVAMLSPPLSPVLPESLEEPTRKPSFDDLLESVKRRKRRSAGAIVEVPSPLSSHPPSPTTITIAEAMNLATASEHVENIANTATASTSGAGPAGGAEAGSTALAQAFDDFDLDFRKSFERAGAALTGFVSAVRSTAALEEEKAETFVKGLRARSPSRREEVKKRWT